MIDDPIEIEEEEEEECDEGYEKDFLSQTCKKIIEIEVEETIEIDDIYFRPINDFIDVHILQKDG